MGESGIAVKTRLEASGNHLYARNHFNSTALQPIVLRDKQS
jgi:hypothetical protein